MSEKRRAEIEAKRAKLADLRKARADRQRLEVERRQSEVHAISSSFALYAKALHRAVRRTLLYGGMSTRSSIRFSAPRARRAPAKLRPRRQSLGPLRWGTRPSRVHLRDRLCSRTPVVQAA